MSKVCRVCQNTHELARFPKNENRCKDCRATYDKQYQRNNPEKRAANQKRYNDKNRDKAATRYNVKRVSDPLFRLRGNLSTLIRKALQAQGYAKDSKTAELLGTDFATVQKHLIISAKRNYGKYFPNRKYHIDHIIPCASAKTEEELLKLQHYTNLQYLTPKDNTSKSDKLDWALIPAI